MSNQNTNYHTSLERISSEVDPVLRKIQRINRRIDVKSGRIPHLITLLFKDMKKLLKIFKGIKNVNITAIPVIGSILSGFFTGILTEWPIYLKGLFVLGVLVVLFALLVPSYLKKMLIFNDPAFHLPSYKKQRKQEYDLISYAVENDISYAGLYDYVTGVLTKQENVSQTITVVTEQYNRDKAELKQENQLLKKQIAVKTNEWKQIIEEFNEEAMDMDIIQRYLIELLADVNVILFRIANGVYDITDLRFISGFTIYEELGKKELKKIYDVGTTGASPETIHVDNQKYKDYSVVAVSKGKLKEPKTNQPRNNYNIISYRMKLGVDGKKAWIMNFHMYDDINRKGWYLLRNSDIINNEEIFRLFHALSLIFYQQKEGGVRNVNRPSRKEGSFARN
ncbi:hypothetical protein M3612_20050 [Niallia taxi]|uniref:hypothetical protein n=1 Tax=Niallia taxi TaxID=2499688 RepID=UPI00203B4A4A|nr:hypothetical protein [Niallia taxi]MCM3216782.1 hypothetical protein [Niallia taxi]